MAIPRLTISSINARPVIAPLIRPVRTAVGTIPSAPLVLIDVNTREGVTGRAYIFAYTTAALPALNRLVSDIGAELAGLLAASRDTMQHFDRRFRLIGWQGLIGMAVSGIDMALWDAVARAADEPLVRLLGGSECPILAYDSYGVIDPKTGAETLASSVASGFKAIKIKLGVGDASLDVATVRAARQAVGDSVRLMADYNPTSAMKKAVTRKRPIF